MYLTTIKNISRSEFSSGRRVVHKVSHLDATNEAAYSACGARMRDFVIMTHPVVNYGRLCSRCFPKVLGKKKKK